MINRLLIHAAQIGDATTVKTLIEQKADINFCFNPLDFTPLIWAARRGHTNVVKILLDFKMIDQEEIQDALRWSVAFDRMDTASYLIDRGAVVNDENEFGNTPLNRAAFNGRINMIRMLLSRGASIDYTNRFGSTSLICASRKNQVESVRELLNQGSNIDHQNQDGRTALMEAADNGCIEVIRELLKRGAAIDLQDATEKNAIKIAYASNHKNIAIEIKKEIENRQQTRREIEIFFIGQPLSHLTFFEKLNPIKKKAPANYLPKELVNIVDEYICSSAK